MQEQFWLYVAGFAFTVIATVIGATWRLSSTMKDQFGDIKLSLVQQTATIAANARADLRDHEQEDQARHVENLGRFGEINEKLARIERRPRSSGDSHERNS